MSRAHLVHGALEFVQLIFGQRLGGEQVHGARAGIAHQQIEHRQVVAQRLAAGGGRDDDDVLAGLNLVEGVGLVGVEARDAALLQRRAQLGIHQRRDIGVDSLGGRLMVDGADGGIRLAMLGAGSTTPPLPAIAWERPPVPGRNREIRGNRFITRFRLFFATLTTKAAPRERSDRELCELNVLRAAHELVAFQRGGDLEVRAHLIRTAVQPVRPQHLTHTAQADGLRTFVVED